MTTKYTSMTASTRMKDDVKYKVVRALLDSDAVICVALNTQNDQHQTKQFETSDGTILAAIQRYTS